MPRFAPTDLQKIKIARITAGASFWISVGIVFFTRGGLAETQAYTLVSIYYLVVVVFEFPTGVIGDHFSHKTAIVAGYITTALSLILLGLGGASPHMGYSIVCLIVAAIGITLVSGSDTALTHSLSSNFKHDQTQIKMYNTVAVVTATAVGPLLFRVYPGLPFILTGVANLVAAFWVLGIRSGDGPSGAANVWHTARTGLAEIRRSPIIFRLLVLSAATSAFLLSLKWFYNPLLARMGIPLQYWGMIMGIGLLMPLVGIHAYRRSKRTNIVAVALLLIGCIVPIGIIQIAAVSIGFVYIVYALNGYLDASIDVTLNEHIESGGRAGILSLGSLLTRLGSSAYLPVAGFALQRTSFITVMAGSAAVLLVVCAPSLLYLLRGRTA